MPLAPPDAIVTALRDFGLVTVEHPGWRTRGTKYSFDPIGQLIHHDAITEKTSDDRALALMVGGRPDLTGPLCNGWIDSDSRVVLVAYGNANHAGRGEADVLALLKAGQPPLGDARTDPDKDGPVGNSHLWGWECRNAGDGVDVWEQLDAMERAAAALAEVCGWSPMAIAGHKEWTARKIDPAGFDMHAFRTDVARIIEGGPMPTPKEIAAAVVAELNLEMATPGVETLVGIPVDRGLAVLLGDIRRNSSIAAAQSDPAAFAAAMADDLDGITTDQLETAIRKALAALGGS